ncbi:MAG: MFS transporter [Dehalococcoidia bacterium]|nr:MFS transporter [Dehalococcoidia bacterium]
MPSRAPKNGFFYGWVIVIISLVTGIMLLGIRHIYGVFFKSISGEFDLTRAVTSGVFSVNMALSAVFSILGGYALDKYGPKFTIGLMGTITCISLVLTALTSSAWQLYLSYSLLLAIGTGATFTMLSALVSRWFHRKRGLALGISSAGGGLGTVILVPLATYLLLSFDWRIANIVIAVIAGIFIIPLAMFLKGWPRELGLQPDGAKIPPLNAGVNNEKPQAAGLTLRQAARMRQFWFLFLVWIFQAFAIYFIVTHIVPHATDVGMSATEAARIVSITGMFQILAGLAAGFFSDAIGRRSVAIISALLGVISLLLLMWSNAFWILYLFSIMFGLCWGGLSTMVSALVGDVFGIRSIGAIMGWIGVAWFIGAAVGPVIGGLIFDLNKSYFLAFLMSAIGMLVTAVLAALIARPKSPPVT